MTSDQPSPDSLRLITEDIPRFWAAYEHLDDPEAAAAFEELYLHPGTAGLQDFTALRIGSAEALIGKVRSRRAYYASLRAATLGVGTSTYQFQTAARALAELYPAATFPPITFLIGRLSTGGTTAEAGILIGTELFTRGPDTPTHELDAWELAVTRPPDILPFIVAHELVHVQQPDAVSQTLLAQCLREGAAEFLGEVISGGVINPGIHGYGKAHEAELWSRFNKEKHRHSTSAWLYQGAEAKGGPADLGYFVGAQICRAYLTHAKDRFQAVSDIINRAVFDPKGFLTDSQYGSTLRP